MLTLDLNGYPTYKNKQKQNREKTRAIYLQVNVLINPNG